MLNFKVKILSIFLAGVMVFTSTVYGIELSDIKHLRAPLGSMEREREALTISSLQTGDSVPAELVNVSSEQAIEEVKRYFRNIRELCSEWQGDEVTITKMLEQFSDLNKSLANLKDLLAQDEPPAVRQVVKSILDSYNSIYHTSSPATVNDERIVNGWSQINKNLDDFVFDVLSSIYKDEPEIKAMWSDLKEKISLNPNSYSDTIKSFVNQLMQKTTEDKKRFSSLCLRNFDIVLCQLSSGFTLSEARITLLKAISCILAKEIEDSFGFGFDYIFDDTNFYEDSPEQGGCYRYRCLEDILQIMDSLSDEIAYKKLYYPAIGPHSKIHKLVFWIKNAPPAGYYRRVYQIVFVLKNNKVKKIAAKVGDPGHHLMEVEALPAIEAGIRRLIKKFKADREKVPWIIKAGHSKYGVLIPEVFGVYGDILTEDWMPPDDVSIDKVFSQREIQLKGLETLVELWDLVRGPSDTIGGVIGDGGPGQFIYYKRQNLDRIFATLVDWAGLYKADLRALWAVVSERPSYRTSGDWNYIDADDFIEAVLNVLGDRGKKLLLEILENYEKDRKNGKLLNKNGQSLYDAIINRLRGYLFGASAIEVEKLGRLLERNRFGGVSQNIFQMLSKGVCVPPGLFYSYLVTRKDIKEAVKDDIKRLEDMVNANNWQDLYGARFGDKDNPLLLTIASDYIYHIPGVSISVPNVGINEEIVEALAQRIGPYAAWDAYRLFLKYYAINVLCMDREEFDGIIPSVEALPETKDLPAEEVMQRVARLYRNLIEGKFGEKAIPNEPYSQVVNIIDSITRLPAERDGVSDVIRRRYLQLLAPKGGKKTGVGIIFQAQVFGTANETLSGSFFAHIEGADVQGTFGEKSQGIEISSGEVSGESITVLKSKAPDLYNEIFYILQKLGVKENTYPLISGVIQNGKIFVVRKQRRLYRRGDITTPESKLEIEKVPRLLEQGTPVCGGTASGIVVFPLDLVRAGRLNTIKLKSYLEQSEINGVEGIILVAEDFHPEDFIRFVEVVNGYIWTRWKKRGVVGVMTKVGSVDSSTSQMADYYNTELYPLSFVQGVKSIVRDFNRRLCYISGEVFESGKDVISIDGNTGAVYKGRKIEAGFSAGETLNNVIRPRSSL